MIDNRQVDTCIIIDVDADAVFRALADPTRRRLLDALHERSGLTLSELCDGLEMRRQSASQHLQLLEEANLISTVRDGRRKLHYLNPVPIHDLHSRWIWKFETPRLAALDVIKRHAERNAMNDPTQPEAGPVPAYVYTTYIHATPEHVWDSLTDPDATARFWGHAQVSTWTVGARVDHVRVDGSGISDVVGTILEADRPRLLAFSFDDPASFDDPTFRPSVVTFRIEAYRDIVKLTVTHAHLRTLTELDTIGHGWPTVLSNLKTLLETGDPLPQAPWEFRAEQRDERMSKTR